MRFQDETRTSTPCSIASGPRYLPQCHAVDSATVVEAAGVGIEPEEGRPLILRVVAADTLKETRAVMEGVGQDVDFGVAEIDEPPVHPDLLDFFERHRRASWIGALGAIFGHRRAGAEDAPSIGAADLFS